MLFVLWTLRKSRKPAQTRHGCGFSSVCFSSANPSLSYFHYRVTQATCLSRCLRWHCCHVQALPSLTSSISIPYAAGTLQLPRSTPLARALRQRRPDSRIPQSHRTENKIEDVHRETISAGLIRSDRFRIMHRLITCLSWPTSADLRSLACGGIGDRDRQDETKTWTY